MTNATTHGRFATGVIGWPIRHSKSPLIHNFWLKHYGIHGVYAPLDVQPQDVLSWIRATARVGFAGLNVTIPHKVSVLSLCGTLSDTAHRCGSVNTLVFGSDGAIHGDSTDGYGFLANIRQSSPGWTAEGQIICLLGAGGAAKAVVAALLDEGASEIRIANRSAEKAEQMQSEFGPRVRPAVWPVSDDFYREANLIVNATSLGMSGGPSWTWRLPELSRGVLATDLIYTPLETPFLRAASAMGATTIDGLGMLLHQAVPGFEHWYGQRPEVTSALRELVLSTDGCLP